MLLPGCQLALNRWLQNRLRRVLCAGETALRRIWGLADKAVCFRVVRVAGPLFRHDFYFGKSRVFIFGVVDYLPSIG